MPSVGNRQAGATNHTQTRWQQAKNRTNFIVQATI